MLDSTAGGGLTSGEAPLEGLIREAYEEASLPPELSRARLRPAGVISVLHIDEGGEVAADVDYVYDLHLPADVEPRPNDSEVDRFELFTVDQLIEALFAGRFMPGAWAALSRTDSRRCWRRLDRLSRPPRPRSRRQRASLCRAVLLAAPLVDHCWVLRPPLRPRICSRGTLRGGAKPFGLWTAGCAY